MTYPATCQLSSHTRVQRVIQEQSFPFRSKGVVASDSVVDSSIVQLCCIGRSDLFGLWLLDLFIC